MGKTSSRLHNRMPRDRLTLLAGVCLVVLLFALPTIHYPFRRDHGEFAAAAQVLLDGGVPYRDVWNPKPPAVLYLYAAVMAVAGPDMVAIHVLDLFAALLAAILLAKLGRQLWGDVGGLVAGVGYGALYFSHRAGDLAQNDGFMTVVMVISAACFWHGRRRGRPVALLGAGLAAGLAVAFKYPSGLWLLLLGGWLLFQRQERLSRRLRQLAVLVLGALAVWGAVLGYLAFRGALPEFLESIWVTPGYTRLWIASDFGLILLGGLGYFFVLQQFGPALLALASVAERPPWPGERALYRFTWTWLVVETLAVCVQFKFYDYHWFPVLPPLVLLMAGGTLALGRLLAKFLRGAAANRGWRVAGWLAAGVVLAYLAFRAISFPWLLGYGWRWSAPDERSYLSRFGGEQDNYQVNVEVARYVAARSSPDDTLFIWGFEPVVYVLSDRRPATRFIYNYPLVGDWYPARWRQEAVDQLRRSPPAFILVVENDSLPTVTGLETDSATQLQDFPELLRLIEEGYVCERKTGGFQIYRSAAKAN